MREARAAADAEELPDDAESAVRTLALDDGSGSESSAGDDDGAPLVPLTPPRAAAVAAVMTAGASTRARSVVASARASALAQALTCLAAVALIWVAAAALVQFVFSDGLRAQPFFLTWMNNSEFLILLPLQAARERWGFAPASDWRGAARAGLLVCPLWFLAQGAYNASLSDTSVSSSTVLSSASCVFTFVLSVVFLREAFRWPKLLGVLVTVAGAACVAAADRGGGGGSAWGDALAIFSSVMYGGYSTSLRALLPDGTRISTWAFFGFLGLFNSLLFAPVVVALVVAGVEAPSTLPPAMLGLLLLKGLADNVLSDVLWARAIQLTSPTLATVALSVTIPLAMLSDLVLHGIAPPALVAVGSAAVMAGFVLTTVSLDSAASKTGAAAAAAATTTTRSARCAKSLPSQRH